MQKKQDRWQLNKQVNLSVIVQLLLLASLIIGSWVNIENQLSLLKHDVENLLKQYEKFEARLSDVAAKNVTFEYRLRLLERMKQDNDNHKKEKGIK